MAIEITIRIENVETERRAKVETGDDRLCVSDYARFFDENSPEWEPNSEYNLAFLKHKQNYANDVLKTKGYLFLNDVYELLGISRTKVGQVVGWIYDEKNPNGDNFVDFDLYADHNKDFVNGVKNLVLLDFNVDGVILDMIP